FFRGFFTAEIAEGHTWLKFWTCSGVRSRNAQPEVAPDIRVVVDENDRSALAIHTRRLLDQRWSRAQHTPHNAALFREGSRSDLELHHFWPCTLAAFLVPGRVHRIARPEPATLPAGIRVVDPSRCRPSGESQRVG